MHCNVRIIKKRIEYLRKEMILTFIQNGADTSHPEVLHLSQLLDKQLNCYEECMRVQKHGKGFVKRMTWSQQLG